MRTLFLICVLILPVQLFGQSSKTYIIADSISVIGLSYWQNNRFTPSEYDVNFADSVVMANIKVIENMPNYYVGMRRGIFCNFKRYIRQYVGFLDECENRIILINYIGDRKIIKATENKNEPIIVLDGGNYFWQAIININEKRLIDVYINGGGNVSD